MRLVNMETSDSSNMGLPRNRDRLNRFLRYCPMCVTEDRGKYGEAYWHRTHQISQLTVCPKHKCILRDSPVIMNRNNTTVLLAAERIGLDCNNISASNNGFENSLSGYMSEVFHRGLNMDSDTNVGDS